MATAIFRSMVCFESFKQEILVWFALSRNKAVTVLLPYRLSESYLFNKSFRSNKAMVLTRKLLLLLVGMKRLQLYLYLTLRWLLAFFWWAISEMLGE